MTTTPDCLRCKSPMEEGFLAERGRASYRQPRWCAGQPEPTVLGSGDMPRRQYSRGTRISAFRCPKCGYLESYAPADPTP